MRSGKRIHRGFFRAQPQVSSFIRLGDIDEKIQKLRIWLLQQHLISYDTVFTTIQ